MYVAGLDLGRRHPAQLDGVRLALLLLVGASSSQVGGRRGAEPRARDLLQHRELVGAGGAAVEEGERDARLA